MNNSNTNKAYSKLNFGTYGWFMIIFSLFMYLNTAGWTVDGINIFTTAFAQAKGWEATTLLSLATPAGLLGVLGSFVFAYLAHKKGPRFVMIMGLIVGGLATIWFGFANAIWQWGAAFMIMNFFGNGYGFIAPGTLMTNWFPTKKGLALGWATMGMPLASVVFVPLLSFLFATINIPNTTLIGGLFMIVLAIVGIIFVKDTPEQLGLYPDNQKISDAEMNRNIKIEDEYISPFTIKKLLKDKDMWLISLGFGFVWLVTLGIIAQLVPRFMSIGYSQPTALAILSGGAICAVFGSLLWGWVDQKVGTRIAGLCYAGVYIVTLLLLAFQIKNSIMTIITIIFLGSGFGGIKNLITSMIGSVYGRLNFTAANRLITPIALVIRTFGFVVLSIGMKVTGSYAGTYLIFIVFDIIGMILIFYISKTPKVST